MTKAAEEADAVSVAGVDVAEPTWPRIRLPGGTGLVPAAVAVDVVVDAAGVLVLADWVTPDSGVLVAGCPRVVVVGRVAGPLLPSPVAEGWAAADMVWVASAVDMAMRRPTRARLRVAAAKSRMTAVAKLPAIVAPRPS